MVDALGKSLGVVTTACKQVGIARNTFYEWYRNDIDFKQQVDDISEVAIDFVESALYKQIDKGNATCIIFFLKTRAKHRGYIETEDNTYQDQTVSFKFTEVK